MNTVTGFCKNLFMFQGFHLELTKGASPRIFLYSRVLSRILYNQGVLPRTPLYYTKNPFIIFIYISMIVVVVLTIFIVVYYHYSSYRQREVATLFTDPKNDLIRDSKPLYESCDWLRPLNEKSS